jgi:hypothetical protein
MRERLGASPLWQLCHNEDICRTAQCREATKLRPPCLASVAQREFRGTNMKRILFGAAALLALAGGASAADLGARPYTKTPA